MPKQSYDIFISYRRSSYDTANLIATRLKAAGYSVFFDLESLRAGKFNEQLYNVIENCKDFISVLPPDALDRCVNEDDWVRLEICHAMIHKKNIVPIMLNGFTWPNPMPAGMEELCNYHALTASSVEHFDMAMESLQKKYLLSKPHVATKLLAKKTGILAVAFVAIVAILYGVFSILSRDVCANYAVKLVNNASAVHILADENAKLKESWSTFETAMKYEQKTSKIDVLRQDVLSRIDLTEKNITTTWIVKPEEMLISNYHSFLLSLNGISSQEIAITPVYSNMIYEEYLKQLDLVRNAVMDPNSINIRLATVLLDMFVHTTNSFYAALLSELSSFPESSLSSYHQTSPTWYHYPRHYVFGEKDKYYEDIINAETKLEEDKLSRFESYLEEQDAELEDLERKLDNMESRMDEDFAKMEADIYREFKNKNTIIESDNQWYKWGKIVHWGAYLSLKIESIRENIKEGIDYNSSVTPDMVCDDIISQLESYQRFHPESKDYVTSAKLFFSEVAKEQLDYAGVMIFAFMEKHPYFQVGDIVVEYNAQKIKTLEDFSNLFKKDKTAKIVFLRYDNGEFKRMEKSLEKTDIVGFVDLTE